MGQLLVAGCKNKTNAMASQKITKDSWWLSPTPLKNMKVSWDYYSQHMEKYKMFQTTNQYMMINADT